MPPTLEARTAERAIACLRKVIEELAAARPRNALAMVANAQDSALALRGMIERQVKNGIPSVHPIRGDEMRALRKLRRDYPRDTHVFVSERGGPISPIGFHRLVQRLGEVAKMPFPIHPHMLRHACGFKLANDGHDTRALQHYLGHKNIQHTVRYTELSPARFRDFWKD